MHRALLLALSLMAGAAQVRADTLHVIVREYILIKQGKAEPVWKTRGKVQEWHLRSTGIFERYGNPIFPDVEGKLESHSALTFSAGKGGRGRIVITIELDEMIVAQAVDNSFGDHCGLVYSYGQEVSNKVEIKVWTTR